MQNNKYCLICCIFCISRSNDYYLFTSVLCFYVSFQMAGRREIYLGFTKILDQTDAVSVERHYLPLGKVGGKPAWLNPVALPSHDQLTCRNCKSPMPFLLQIYCSGKEDHAFHRYIYVFICSNPECYKVGLFNNSLNKIK